MEKGVFFWTMEYCQARKKHRPASPPSERTHAAVSTVLAVHLVAVHEKVYEGFQRYTLAHGCAFE